MKGRPGSAIWLLQHELRMFVRNTLTSGKQAGQPAAKDRRLKRTLFWVVAGLSLVMHAAAFMLLTLFDRDGPMVPHSVIMVITLCMLGVMTLMLSTSLSASVEALFERGDLDLLLASPLSSHSVFAVRLAGIVTGTAGLYLFFLAPLAHMGVLLGQFRWVGIYPTILGMATIAASLGILLTLGLAACLGVRRTRVVAQILAWLPGLAIFLQPQLKRLFEPGLQARQLPGPDSWLWLLAQAPLGAPVGMLVIGLTGAAAFYCTVRFTHGFFVRGVLQAASAVRVAKAPADPARMQFGRSLAATVVVKEWRLIRRDPQLIGEILMPLSLMLPLGLIMFSVDAPALPGVAAGLTFGCAVLTGALAWIMVAAEGAPDLLRAAPASTDTVKLAKMAAVVLPALALVFVPLAWVGLRASLTAVLMLIMVAVGAANNALIVKWCARTAARSDLTMRARRSTLINLLELVCSMLWAAASFLLVLTLDGASRPWLCLLGAGAAALLALVVLGLARYFRPEGD